MASRAPLHPAAKRIASPAVRAKIRAVIGKRLQPSDADDVMQRVYTRLLVLQDRLPEGDEPLLGLVATITNGRVLDHFRAAGVRQARDADESEAVEVAEPPETTSLQTRLEWKELYAVAEAMVTEGAIEPEVLRWAERLARGDEYDDIERDEGIPAATIRKRMERARKLLRARWREISGVAGAILGVILLFLYFRRPPRPAILPDAYSPPPRTTSAPAVETDAQKVARFIDMAQVACNAKEYDQCEATLNDAAAIDREVNERPVVIKMRHAIEDGRRKTPGRK